MPQLILIAAIDKNNAIGFNNQLIYHLPNDLKRFKNITSGHTVLMGRKTFESLPKGALPNRRNIILSKSLDKPYPNTEICSSIEQAIELCQGEDKIFIIGGEQIYNATIQIANTLEITEIDKSTNGADAFFPKINKKAWKEINRESHVVKTDNEEYSYHYVTYKKQ